MCTRESAEARAAGVPCQLLRGSRRDLWGSAGRIQNHAITGAPHSASAPTEQSRLMQMASAEAYILEHALSVIRSRCKASASCCTARGDLSTLLPKSPTAVPLSFNLADTRTTRPLLLYSLSLNSQGPLLSESFVASKLELPALACDQHFSPSADSLS